MAKIGSEVSTEFAITKGLQQVCTLLRILFKIYHKEALKNWKVGEGTLYTLLFAGDQVLIAADADDASY